jgi:2-(1,2-epoxy-1,2-dihydrophenyl)acetyl-CoA isomerase
MTAVVLQIEEAVATLTLNRPERGNAIDLVLARELRDAMVQIAAQDVRALLVQGSGRHFCLGGDIRIPELDDAAMQAHVLELTRTLHAGLSSMLRLNAPVIAAVNGGVAGAGLGLLGVSDLVVAAEDAFFVGAFTAVGLTPDSGVSLTLPRVIGARRAAQLLLTERRINSATALEWGLVNDLTAPAELRGHAQILARKLAAGATGALGATRQLMATDLQQFEAHLEREAQCIAARRIGTEGKEGVRAQLERRPPEFALRRTLN